MNHEKPPEYYDIQVAEEEGAYDTPYIDTLTGLVVGSEWWGGLDPYNYEDRKKIKKLGVDGSLLSQMLLENPPKDQEVEAYFLNLIKGKDVLDLGIGRGSGAYQIAQHCGANKYVGVEKNFALSASTSINTKSSSVENPISTEVVQEDMIKYLEDLVPQSFGVVFLMGVDINIIPRELWPKLLEKIKRVLKPDGCLLIGGGAEKPWEEILKIFRKEQGVEKIDQRFASERHLYGVLPSVLLKE